MDFGFRVLGLRVLDFGFGVLGLRVLDFGLKASGFRVLCSGAQIANKHSRLTGVEEVGRVETLYVAEGSGCRYNVRKAVF